MILSIIIPVYNVEKYLEKCVRSTQVQDIPFSEYEVIIINDGSPDNSLAIAERLAVDLPNVKVYSQKNQGLSAARNTGMCYAKGDYYMFLDSDDWISENCLGSIIKKLRDERPDVLAICACNEYQEGSKIRKIYNDESVISGVQHMLDGIEYCAPFGIWRADFLKTNNLSFFVGIFHEDEEFTPRAYYKAKKVSRLGKLVYHVFQNPKSITRSFNPKKGFDLIQVVCPHLSSFCEEVIESECRDLLNTRISLLFNNGLNSCKDADAEIIDRLNLLCYEKRNLFVHLIHSSKLKYRVEGILFSIFPKHIMSIYRFIQKFNF